MCLRNTGKFTRLEPEGTKKKITAYQCQLKLLFFAKISAKSLACSNRSDCGPRTRAKIVSSSELQQHETPELLRAFRRGGAPISQTEGQPPLLPRQDPPRLRTFVVHRHPGPGHRGHHIISPSQRTQHRVTTRGENLWPDGISCRGKATWLSLRVLWQ